jgi:DMSO/TMAO reductase YedYZ molybdopterin-dependent catalytic subunit
MKERMPPNQHLSKTLIPLHIESPIPSIPEEAWTLKVEGLVETPVLWTLAQLKATFADSLVGDFHCVTGWSSFDLRLEGLTLSHLMELVKPKPEARHVLFQAEGVYTTNLPLEYLRREPAIIAWQLNGAPVPRNNGGPLRFFVPGKYAYKAIKWLRSIRFLEREERGYWEVRGYSNSADPWKEERFD